MTQTRLKVGSYEAWVVVENEDVEHYEIDVDEEEKIATCWIASTAGKRFGIWVVKHHCKFACMAYVNLDGSKMRACSFAKQNEEPKLIDEVIVGKSLFQPFLFGALNLTEEESALSTQMHEELGTIKVVLRRIVNYKFSCWSVKQTEGSLQLPEVKIHERAKKLATHQVLFGEIRSNPEETTGRATFERREIVATFIFHYRSLDMLKAREIVPCDPRPVSVGGPSEPGKRKAELIEEEEEKPIVETSEPESEEDNLKRIETQLQVTLRSCQAELEKVKQARLDYRQSKGATKRVKREPKPGPVFLPGEVIDLTI